GKLDFLTTPGYLTGSGAREAAGLPPGSGPYRVITDLAVLGYHPENRRMQLRSIHAGVTLDQVRQCTGFELEVSEALTTTPAPAAAELEVLRSEVDPHRYVLGRPC